MLRALVRDLADEAERPTEPMPDAAAARIVMDAINRELRLVGHDKSVHVHEGTFTTRREAEANLTETEIDRQIESLEAAINAIATSEAGSNGPDADGDQTQP